LFLNLKTFSCLRRQILEKLTDNFLYTKIKAAFILNILKMQVIYGNFYVPPIDSDFQIYSSRDCCFLSLIHSNFSQEIHPNFSENVSLWMGVVYLGLR